MYWQISSFWVQINSSFQNSYCWELLFNLLISEVQARLEAETKTGSIWIFYWTALFFNLGYLLTMLAILCRTGIKIHPALIFIYYHILTDILSLTSQITIHSVDSYHFQCTTWCVSIMLKPGRPLQTLCAWTLSLSHCPTGDQLDPFF